MIGDLIYCITPFDDEDGPGRRRHRLARRTQLRAYCSSDECTREMFQEYRNQPRYMTKWGRIVHDAKRNQFACDRCGHALFWTNRRPTGRSPKQGG